MVRLIAFAASILLLAFPAAGTGEPEVILLDTFDDDVVGQFPGTPEIGTSSHWGILNHTIIDDYGSPRLRLIDILPTDGTGSTWYPTRPPVISEVSYTFRVEVYGGAYPVAQRFEVNNGGTTEALFFVWRGDGMFLLGNTLLQAYWSAGQDYDIWMKIDCVHNRVELLFDIIFWTTFPIECDSLDRFAVTTYEVASNATFSIDNVMIVDFLPLFFDGFEGGDTTQWSATTPPP